MPQVYNDPAYVSPAADFRQQVVKFVRKDGFVRSYRLMSALSIDESGEFEPVQGSYPEPVAWSSGRYVPVEGSFDLIWASWLDFLDTFLAGKVSEVQFDMYIYTKENGIVRLDILNGVRLQKVSRDTSEGPEPIKVQCSYRALQSKPNAQNKVAQSELLIQFNVLVQAVVI